MAVRGSLQDLDLLSLLQMTCEEGGDAQIVLQRGVDTATLYIQGGQIVHAEGLEQKGEEAVFTVLGWRYGTFALARTVTTPTTTITTDWNSLLLEGLRRLDELNGDEEDGVLEVRHKTVLAVSDDAALLEKVAAALEPYGGEFAVVTAETQAEAVALLKQPPDVMVLGWKGSPTADAALFAALVGQKVPVPVVLAVTSDESRLPSISPFNPVIFLANPLDSSELVAALWAQVAREATGEPVGLPLYALCEWLRLEKRTCLIRVLSKNEEGMLAFVDGVLMNAVCGQKLGEEAARTIFGWEGVSIEFAEVIAKIKPLIQRALSDVLGKQETESGKPKAEASPAAPLANADIAESVPSIPGATDAESEAEKAETEALEVSSLTPVGEAEVSETESVAVLAEGGLPSTDDDSEDIEVVGAEDLMAEPTPTGAEVILGTVTESSTSIIHNGSVNGRAPLPSQGENSMAVQTTEGKIEKTLAEIMTINGALGVALVDLTSGMALGKTGNTGLDLDIAAAGNSEVVKSKMNVMRDLGIRGQIEDILITLQTQYHLIRPLGSDSSLFLYVVLNKETANLALARRQLSKSEAGLIM
jgi:CheY-like chemotaxis protein